MTGGDTVAPADPQAGTRVLLATADPVFAVLCQRALAEARPPHTVVAVSPPELLELARHLPHEVLILDADHQDIATLKALAGKVMLVSDAPVVLISGYLAPGSPGLTALLASIAAQFVQKPQGAASLSLADDDGPAFVTALQAAFSAYEGEGRDLGGENAVERTNVDEPPAGDRARNG
jgi:chemotaxis response regulator CheB